jgi:hypothetical protein
MDLSGLPRKAKNALLAMTHSGFFMIKPLCAGGFSLLEVLIATFILTVGLLGVIGIYMHSYKRMENSCWYSLANSQLVSMLEMGRVSGYEYSSLQKECGLLLPHGECKLEAGVVKVCWQERQKKRCLSH